MMTHRYSGGMTSPGNDADLGTAAEQLVRALNVDDPSDRLEAALAAGSRPDDSYLEPLVSRCAVEPDFYVRDMLTWALTRLDPEIVVPRVIAETSLDPEHEHMPQAVSQALHTLSKLQDHAGWPAAKAHLHSPYDEVAAVAWRTAVGLAPEVARPGIAADLVDELGRGGFELQRSLARELAGLGELAVPALELAVAEEDEDRARHARAALRVVHDPEATFFLD